MEPKSWGRFERHRSAAEVRQGRRWNRPRVLHSEKQKDGWNLLT